MPKSPLNELQTIIRKLHSERQTHVEAIERIDSTFDELGIEAESPRRGRRGRPPGRPAGRYKAGRRRKRRKYATSGTESILSFVSRGNKKGATGAEIANHWKAEGRAGSSYNIINMLLKAGKLKKKKLKGERGSMYMAA